MNSFGFFVDWQLGIALLWLVYRTALRGRVAHSAARAYLLFAVPVAATVAAMKLPVLSPVVLYAAPAAIETTTATTFPTTVAISETPVDWLSIGYWAVAAGLAVLFMAGAARWIVRWHRGLECGGVRFCPQGRAVAASLFGRIGVDPNCLGSDALESILAHERAHVAQKHSWDMLYMSIVRSVLWINPAVWLLARDLRWVHEAQADAAVLESGFSPERYIHTLLDAEIGAIGGPIPGNLAPIHYFSFCSTKKRIEMMTKLVPSRRSLWRLTAALPVLGAMLVLFSFTRPVVVEPTPKAALRSEAYEIVTRDNVQPALVVVYQKSTYDGDQFVEFRRSLEGGPKLDPAKIASVEVIKGEHAVQYMNLDPASEAGKTVAAGGVIVIDMKGADPAHKTNKVMSLIKDAEYIKPLTQNFFKKSNPAVGSATRTTTSGDMNPNESYAVIVEQPDQAGNCTIRIQKGMETKGINADQIQSVSIYKDEASLRALAGNVSLGDNGTQIASKGLAVVLMKGASMPNKAFKGTINLQVAPGCNTGIVTFWKQVLRANDCTQLSYSSSI